jgi:hypothetical protein
MHGEAQRYNMKDGRTHDGPFGACKNQVRLFSKRTRRTTHAMMGERTVWLGAGPLRTRSGSASVERSIAAHPFISRSLQSCACTGGSAPSEVVETAVVDRARGYDCERGRSWVAGASAGPSAASAASGRTIRIAEEPAARGTKAGTAGLPPPCCIARPGRTRRERVGGTDKERGCGGDGLAAFWLGR